MDYASTALAPTVASDPSPAARPAISSAAEPLPFSWGAAGVPVLWHAFHGKGGLALAILFFNVLGNIAGKLGPEASVIGVVISVVVFVILGNNGSKIAMEHRGYASIAELEKGERAWTVFGVISFAIVMCLGLVALSVAIKA